MAGFQNDVVFANNIDFSGSFPASGEINLNGELLVGATVAPFIRPYVPTGSNGLVVNTGPGTLDFSLANVPNSALQNNTITLSAGTGLTGGGIINLGGANTISLSTPVTVANGGTGRATLTNHGVLVGAATTAITQLAAGSAGQVLQSGGAAADPAYSTPTYPSASGTAGLILVSDGTNNVYSTPTFPNASATLNKVIKSDGTNWVASTETYAVPGTSGNVLTSDGTNWTSATPTPIFKTASGALTNSQIKALHATPVQLIAAPGNGKVINIVQITGKLAYGGTSAFTAGAAQSIQAYYGTALSIANILNNAGVVATANQYSIQGGQFNSSLYSSAMNAAVNAWNPIATEITGNAANDNTVPFFIVYYIVTI